jgi:hypothetical protein
MSNSCMTYCHPLPLFRRHWTQIHLASNNHVISSAYLTTILEVYTNIHISLHQQLVHLSSAAHLILAFYAKEKGGSMPSQLYFDLMTMVKNAYFCVAKTQIDNPEGSFWIILLGSDPLEALFGKVWTIQGNDSNVDQLQLASRTDSAVICTKILAKHPEWERGPR